MNDFSHAWPFGLNGPRWWLPVAGVVALMLVAISLDRELSVWAGTLPGGIRRVMVYVTHLGESGWILYPALALWFVTALLTQFVPWHLMRLMLKEQAATYGFIFLGVAVPGLISSLLKGVVGRARPIHLDTVGTLDFRFNLDDWTYQSFPSGHTTTAFALAAVVGFLGARWFLPMLVLALAIAASRVVLEVHYPSDVLAGAILGLLGAYWIRTLFASRDVLFRRMPDGTIRKRKLVALRRYIALKRRRSA